MNIISLAKLLKTKIQGIKIIKFLWAVIILSAFLFTAHMFRYEPIGDGSMLYDRWMNRQVQTPPSLKQIDRDKAYAAELAAAARPLPTLQEALAYEFPPMLDIALRELKNQFWLTAESPEGQVETQRIWDQHRFSDDIRDMWAYIQNIAPAIFGAFILTFFVSCYVAVFRHYYYMPIKPDILYMMFMFNPLCAIIFGGYLVCEGLSQMFEGKKK